MGWGVGVITTIICQAILLVLAVKIQTDKHKSTEKQRKEAKTQDDNWKRQKKLSLLDVLKTKF